MRRWYPGEWKIDDKRRLVSLSAAGRCSGPYVGVGEQDRLVLTRSAGEFQILEQEDGLAMLFDTKNGGFLQVSESCAPFIESDDDVTDDMVDESRLFWKMMM